MVNYLNDIEMGLCLRINALSRKLFIRRFFSGVSRLGDYPAWAAIGIAIIISQGANGPVFVAQTLLTVGAGTLIYKLLKQRLVRERPYITHEAIVCGTAPLDRYSFPSGHTLHAVSLTILYSAYEPVLLLIMLPFAALVAASRIVLGLHYPSDVLVGAAIGATLATASLTIYPV